MNWSAPDVVNILEQRLRTARLELMDDPRVRHAHEARSKESVNFVVQLIEDKLATAARFGMEAAEASLRLSATDALLSEGVAIANVRHRLEDAGNPLLQPGRPLSAAVRRAGVSARVETVVYLFLWTVVTMVCWAVLRFEPLLCALIVGAGAVSAVPLYRWRSRRFGIMLRRIVSELPSRTVRHYLQHLRKCVADYEGAVACIALEASARENVNPGVSSGRR